MPKGMKDQKLTREDMTQLEKIEKEAASRANRDQIDPETGLVPLVLEVIGSGFDRL